MPTFSPLLPGLRFFAISPSLMLPLTLAAISCFLSALRQRY
jgi:hypothetical protein